MADEVRVDMSTNLIVQGLKIHLRETIAQDTSIGLYSNSSTLTGNASVDQAVCAVTSSAGFDSGDTVVISDDNASEVNVIKSISGNNLTMRTNLKNTYTTVDNGAVAATQFRWIENTITGTTLTWATGILGPNGLPPTTTKINSQRGGDVALVSDIDIAIDNTSQFFNTIDTAGISLGGLRADVVEFTRSVSGGTTTEVIRYRGIVLQSGWNVGHYGITLESAYHNRTANISTKLSDTDSDTLSEIGKESIPVIFGKFEGTRYAKAIQTVDKEDVFVETTWNEMRGVDYSWLPDDTILYPDWTVKHNGINSFPVVGNDGNDPTLTYDIQIGNTAYYWTDGDGVPLAGSLSLTTEWAGKYIKVVAGNAATDEYRQIVTAVISNVASSDNMVVRVTVTSYFSETLVGNSSATAEGNTWVTILDIEKQYDFDSWPLKSFVDSDGTVITQGAELYQYDQERLVSVSGNSEVVNTTDSKFEYVRIPPYSLDIDGTSSNRTLIINAHLFNSPDRIDGFLILPMHTIYPLTWSLATKYSSVLSIGAERYPGVLLNSDYAPGATYSDLFGLPHENALPYGDAVLVHNEAMVWDASSWSTIATAASDKNHTTSAYFAFTVTTDADTPKATYAFFWGLGASLPTIPSTWTFKKCYLGIYYRGTVSTISGTYDPNGYCASGVHILARRFMGTPLTIYSDKTTHHASASAAVSIDLRSLPDFYYTSGKSDNDVDFYPIEETMLEPADDDIEFTLNGYPTFEIPNITTAEQYKALHEIALFIEHIGYYVELGTGSDWHTRNWLTELAVIFEKEISIAGILYTTMHGRIFNDTWKSRKTAADLMETLPDIMEHTCRLQNWSETGDVSVEYGKEYTEDALVNVAAREFAYDNLSGSFTEGEQITSGTNSAYILIDTGTRLICNRFVGTFSDNDTITGAGSGATADVDGSITNSQGGFDSPALDDVGALRLSFQIHDYDKAYTTEIKKRLCKTGWCVNYVNERGEECLSFLPRTETATITDTITLAHVPEGIPIGDVEEVKAEHVYAEPFVRYNFNQGSGKFDGLIAIQQIHRASWSSDYTPGFMGSEGQTLWESCQTNIWNKYRIVNQPPSNLTDRYELYSYADARWFLTQWIAMMTIRRISVPVYYDLAKTWNVGRHIYLNFPHQTNGAALECFIEGITKDHGGRTRTPHCVLKLGILDSIPTDSFIRDVMYTEAEGADADWVDTHTEYSNDNDKVDKI